MTAASPPIPIGAGRPGRSRPRALPVAERLSSPRLGLLWLVRLRWHALAGIALAMTLAPWLMGVSVPWRPAFALVGGIALSNLGCALWAGSDRRVSAAALGALLIADTALLTA